MSYLFAFSPCILLRRGVEKAAWWAPGRQPRLTHRSWALSFGVNWGSWHCGSFLYYYGFLCIPLCRTTKPHCPTCSPLGPLCSHHMGQHACRGKEIFLQHSPLPALTAPAPHCPSALAASPLHPALSQPQHVPHRGLQTALPWGWLGSGPGEGPGWAGRSPGTGPEPSRRMEVLTFQQSALPKPWWKAGAGNYWHEGLGLVVVFLGSFSFFPATRSTANHV